MFHHFWDAVHPRGQGAISAHDLEQMISFVGRDNILDAQEWTQAVLTDSLPKEALTLTFDDALKCQMDVAIPVLDAYGIKATFFIYSSVFEGGVEPLEIFRLFRTVAFNNIDDFYEQFYSLVRAAHGPRYDRAMRDFIPENYLAESVFYTRNDRIFRFLRDDVLGPEKYNAIINEMIAKSSFRVEDHRNRLWMDNADIQKLHVKGHTIGLHSYTHPTRLARMPAGQQEQEYRKNFDHITAVTGQAPVSMSHPCESYTPDTIRILKSMGIKIGFRASAGTSPEYGMLELPRSDHADILRQMTL